MRLNVNGKDYDKDVPNADTPLLWVLRDYLGLVGTKFGCGIAQCGACTVHVDGNAMFSCSTPAAVVEGRSITTIEGLADEDGTLQPLQQAWIDHDVPQCGYCQAGQIMRAAVLLEENPNPTRDQVDAALSPNLCRCGTYNRIRTAVLAAAGGDIEA